jgi:hypothetical protein
MTMRQKTARIGELLTARLFMARGGPSEIAFGREELAAMIALAAQLGFEAGERQARSEAAEVAS